MSTSKKYFFNVKTIYISLIFIIVLISTIVSMLIKNHNDIKAVFDNVEIILIIEGDEDIPIPLKPNNIEYNRFLKYYGINWKTKKKTRSFRTAASDGTPILCEYSWILVGSNGTYDSYIFDASINGKEIERSKEIKYGNTQVPVGSNGRFTLVLAPPPDFTGK